MLEYVTIASTRYSHAINMINKQNNPKTKKIAKKLKIKYYPIVLMVYVQYSNLKDTKFMACAQCHDALYVTLNMYMCNRLIIDG